MRVLDAQWPSLSGLPLKPIDEGLINDTWCVGDPAEAILQRVNPIFGGDVHLDIDAITTHLAKRGMETPRLLPTASGSLFHRDEEGRIWRAMTFVDGVTWARCQSPEMAYEAGALVARWHRALDDFPHVFHFKRLGVHDTVAHMEKLEGGLRTHGMHRLFSRVEPLAEEVLRQWERWEGCLENPLRIAHGDLKLSNLRFSEAGKGVSLLDLDTMGRLSLDVEMGDAWRSWCNRSGENDAGAGFDLSLFEASVVGYCSEKGFSPAERETLPGGVERISLELASRFLFDALEESYFGWDERIASTRGEHNLIRGEGQLDLARSLSSLREDMERVLRNAS